MIPDYFVDDKYRDFKNVIINMGLPTKISRGQPGKLEVCGFMNCPKIYTLKTALRETIQVLESTKGAFKSPQLGALRKKLKKLRNLL